MKYKPCKHWHSLTFILIHTGQEPFWLTVIFIEVHQQEFCISCWDIQNIAVYMIRWIPTFNILSRATSLRAPSFGGVRTWVEGLWTWIFQKHDYFHSLSWINRLVNPLKGGSRQYKYLSFKLLYSNKFKKSHCYQKSKIISQLHFIEHLSWGFS